MARGDYDWIIGAGVGFALGGPLGAIVGGLLGGQARKLMGGVSVSTSRNRHNTGHYTAGVQEGDLLISFLVLSAAVTKADDEIRSAEVRMLKEYLVRSFGVSRTAALMKLYKEILEQPIDLNAVIAQIRDEADQGFKLTIVRILVDIALADNELAAAEKEILHTIALGIGVNQAEFNAAFSSTKPDMPHRDYALLESKPSDSDDTLKSRYRELVKKYHPDKVGHLGPEFKTLAETKFKEIGSAWERIRKSRGMT